MPLAELAGTKIGIMQKGQRGKELEIDGKIRPHS
jgi:hypothetical protein